MPSTATLDNLKSELEQKRNEYEQKRREVLALEQALAILTGDAVLIADASGTVPVLRKTAEYSGLGITDAASRFIKEIGEPRSTREIADALIARGLETKSKNFTATVYATLVNSKRFKRTKDDRWEPIESKD